MIFLPLLTVLPLALGLTVPLDTTLTSFTNGNGDLKLGRPARPALLDVNAALNHVSNLDLNTGINSRDLDFDLKHVSKVDVDATIHHLDNAVHHVDFDSKVLGTTTLGTRTTLLPDLEAGASFCITLGTAVTVDGIMLNAGICLCADALVEANQAGGPVQVVASSGQVFTGATAIKLRQSMLFAQFGTLFDLQGAIKVLTGTYFDLGVASNVCLQVDLFVGHSQHDFSQGASNCCARQCIAPYVSGANDQCVCPGANQCQNQCLTGPALECNGQCYLQSEYTCPSGMPVPKQQPGRKRDLTLSGKCQGYGKELCAVTGSIGWECIDIFADMESCGGCVLSQAGKQPGTDCTSIPFVDEVLCHLGSCLVLSCEKGYQPAQNGTLCIDINVDVGLDASLRGHVYDKGAHSSGAFADIDVSLR